MSTTISYRQVRPGTWVSAAVAGWPQTRAWLFGFLLIAPVAADQGGYWPTAWGWTALGLTFVGMLALILGEQRRPGGLELLFLGTLTALLVWIALSSVWGASATQPVRETERTIVYVTAVAAALVLVRRTGLPALVGGVWAATALVTGYALLTRLVPDHFGVFDPLAGHRLASPVGYWNALGIFAAIGALIALGLAARAASLVVAAAAGASLLVLVPTLYFTFSRGAWICLGIGLAAAVAVDPRRLQLVTQVLLIAPWVVAAVLIASRSTALTHTDATVGPAAHEGHRLVWILCLLALGSVASVLICRLGRRFTLPAWAGRAYGITLALAVVACVAAVLAVYGSPWAIAERGYRAFTSSPTSTSTNLNKRLFSFSGTGRADLWRVAWRDVEAHPLLGSGAGTYERYWNELRPRETKVRDAHNLYLETLAEVGPLGLVLLVAALTVPFVAVARARHRPLVPALVGAYVAFLVHAAVDWDWEVPAVALTALLCGAAITIAARSGTRGPLGARMRLAGLGLLLALGVFAFFGLRGNLAIAASETAAGKGKWVKSATEARTASSWVPWSSRPWQLLGEAQYNGGDLAEARQSFRSALAKDASDWTIWLDLALASDGAERRRALAQASKLNPHSSLIQLFESNPPGGSGG